MKQKNMLSLTLTQLKQLYYKEFPRLKEMAENSQDNGEFKNKLKLYLSSSDKIDCNTSKQIRLLIDYDEKNIHELSTNQDVSVQTILLLYQFLTGQLENVEMVNDLFVDLYYLFKRLENPEQNILSATQVRNRSKRWETGLAPEVIEIRQKNKERMLHLLIQKIENRKPASSRFHFNENLNYDEKYQLVKK